MRKKRNQSTAATFFLFVIRLKKSEFNPSEEGSRDEMQLSVLDKVIPQVMSWEQNIK